MDVSSLPDGRAVPVSVWFSPPHHANNVLGIGAGMVKTRLWLFLPVAQAERWRVGAVIRRLARGGNGQFTPHTYGLCSLPLARTAVYHRTVYAAPTFGQAVVGGRGLQAAD
jgi:hypothetical protein